MRRATLFLILLLLALLSACARQPGLPVLPFVLPEGEARPLEVVFASPRGQVENLSDTAAITAVFNQAMVPLQSVEASQGQAPARIEPAVPGRWRWRGTATLTFEPTRPLPKGTKFAVTIPAGTKSYSEQTLAKDYTWDFTTPRLDLAQSIPAAGDEYVRTDATVNLFFDQPILPEASAGKIQLFLGKEVVAAALRRPTDEEWKGLQDRKERNEDEDGEDALAGPTLEQVLALDPSESLQLGKAYTVRLAAGLTGQEGALGLEQGESFSFQTVNRFEVEPITSGGDDWRPDSSVVFHFSNPVAPADLAKNLTFTPEVKVPDHYADDDYHSTEVWLRLPLKARTSYRVRISGALKDEFGNTLGRPTDLAFDTRDFSPALVMAEGLGVLEAEGDLRVPVGFRNVNRAQVRMAVVEPGQVVPLVEHRNSLWGGGDYTPPGGWEVERNWTPEVPRNRFMDLPLSIKPALNEKRAGFVYVQLSSRLDDEEEDLRLLLQVTRLGLTAKFSPQDTLVWVTTLGDAKPKAGAVVEIRSADNRVLFTGKTNSEGLVRAPGWAALGLKKTNSWDTPTQYVFARDGEDVAFLSPEGSMGISPWDFDLDYDWSPRARTYAGHAFTERGLYRAGEQVYLKGTVRRERGGRWTIPDDVKHLEYTITDSRDEKVQSGRLELSRFGSFDHTLDLARTAPSGFYRASFSLPKEVREDLLAEGALFATSFRVEAYRPAQFEVLVEPGQKACFLGDTATAVVRGKYLFGAPMSEDAVTWSARLVPSAFSPKQWEGFNFGPMTFWAEDRRDQERVLARSEGRLDGQGRLDVKVQLEGVSYEGSGELVVEGTVTSASRQKISGRASVPVFPAACSIGLKAGGMLQRAGSPVTAQMVVVDPEGRALTGRKVQVELIRREWHSVRKAGAGGRYEWVSEKEDSVVGTTSATSDNRAVEVPVSPPKSGFYLVRATTDDEKGRKAVSEDSFYAWGGDYVAWARQDDDRIELVADKQRYAPGDTAHILVKSPYEKARALVTVERELVLDRFVTEVNGSADTVDIPIRSAHLPNVYVSVVLIQGRLPDAGFGPDGMDLGKPSFKIGYVNLPVDSGEKRLKVGVSTDRPTYEPRQTVQVLVEVKDHQGRPKKAEVCLAVVDEGVLSLIGYQTPGYFDAFYGQRALSVKTAESRLDVIGQRAYGAKGETDGGGGGLAGGGLAGDYREDFTTTPFWSPRLVTDDQGVARATFTLPDSLTSFRVMAMVQSMDSDFGSADQRIQVQKPLLLQPSLPRFSRVGDRFRAGVLVFNHTERAGEVLVEAEAVGVKLGERRQFRVQVAAGQEREVLFDFEAPEAAEAELGFKASMGTHSDSLKMPLPVLRPVATETTATSGSTDRAKVTEGLQMPGGILPGSATLETSVASSALAGLDGALSELLGYPYGCLEQRLSSMVPMILAEDLVRTFEVQGVDAAQMRSRVQKGLDELVKFQLPSGGFSLWPGGEKVNDYVTAYCLVTLRQARENGYRVEDELVRRGRAYMKTVMNRTTFDYPYSQDEAFVVRPYLLYALSLYDFRDPSTLNRLYGDRRKMPLDGKVYLLMAARRMKADESILRTLQDEIVSSARVEAQTTHFEQPDVDSMGWVFASNVRTTGLALRAMLDGGDFPLAPRIARWLMEARRDGHWGSTQENVAALEALQAYYRRYELAAPDMTCQVRLAGKEVLQAEFRGRSTQVRAATTVLEEVPSGETVEVSLDKQGKGRAYFDLRLRYAPAQDPPPRDQGFAVFKAVEPLEGDGAVVGAFLAGKTYRVTLSVLTPSERRYVVVDDPVPAGFEVVQTTFATESDDLREAMARAGLAHPWFATFNHWEIEDSRVLLFADGLRAGEHTFQYLVRAMHPGEYSAPSAKAEEMYHPEIFGTTGSHRVTVE